MLRTISSMLIGNVETLMAIYSMSLEWPSFLVVLFLVLTPHCPGLQLSLLILLALVPLVFRHSLLVPAPGLCSLLSWSLCYLSQPLLLVFQVPSSHSLLSWPSLFAVPVLTL